jgi:uncharacterized cupredoxin-like copper-binding protein
MKLFNALLAVALLGASLGTVAHEGASQDGRQLGPVKKEQKDWGVAGDAQAVNRTIEVSMGDSMRFSPDTIAVKQGEVVKFVIRNNGKLAHEMVVGTRKMLDEHAALMVKFPTMEHEEPYMTHVAPGKTGVMIWNFNRAGDFDFGCLVPGHYPAGMTGKINVAAVAASAAKPAAAEMTEAEVRKVDKENRKITLKHGAIKNLDMPPMTMVFGVSDAKLLDNVKAGDKVRFTATGEGGKYTVTTLQPAR